MSEVGKTLGKYKVTRRLGEGGMGVVFAGEHEQLAKQVAIKVVTPQLSKNAEVIRRFFAEARAAAAVNHPGIIDVFDYGEDPETGSAYFVMELLDGESLADALTRGPMPVERAIPIAEQIADTLAAAHANGIVHRDLKPDNVFLVPDRLVACGVRVKVLDFGVAKLIGDDLRASVQTKTGSLLGTPYYMSPEQSHGASDIDHRSDIYSLGCVLFEMVCGRVPFPGDGLGQVLGAHQHLAPPTPSSISRRVPEVLDALIVAMLAKAPDDRPQSMREVVDQLDVAAGGGKGGTLKGPAGPAFDATMAAGAASAPPVDPRYAATAAADNPGKRTTLGGAAAQMTAQVAPPSPSNKAPWIAGVAVLAVAGTGVGIWAARQGGDPPAVAVVDASADAQPIDAAPEPGQKWVRVEPPAQPVILGVPAGVDQGKAFLPEAGIKSPAKAFEIHAMEVSWAELDGFLPKLPEWAPPSVPREPEARAALPVTGIPWEVARSYCRFVGGRLPTEEELELAARGAELRPHPWGDAPIDLAKTYAFRGAGAPVVEVGTSEQDVTPDGIHDLAGNVQEWTADEWRKPTGDVQRFGPDFDSRAIRGMPIHNPRPAELPTHSGAFRDILCSGGKCLKHVGTEMPYVGFRCAR